MTAPSRVSFREVLSTRRYGRKTGQLCYAYGGTMPDGRVRLCEKPRGHLDSHAYEFEDVLLARHGVRERR